MSIHRILAAAGASVWLSACAHSGEVYLRSESGATVKCGPYQALYTIYAPADYLVDSQLRDCIEDHQRQGYERLPPQQASR